MKKAWPQLAIAVVLCAVVAMLIVPVPRPLLDALLTLNIGVAVALLMASVFTPRPLTFTSFPTLLVVTTLFRVGLEVSVTRWVLADADAGEVVRAFGSSVVADSLVVGLVVFVVITVVQLIVVARGAERVAEVAARFALDALPGKQMAIDAEQRAGAIDGDTARRRRADLERESQLFGAMDGAMRFVRGDAIAAILIVIVNLVGGLAVGVGSRGMTASDAVHTYSLLSVGEGLLAQIPSLLVAVASGLLVTRVASAGDRALADDLPQQLAGSPRALIGAAIVMVGLGLVPGLPLAPFALLGALAGAAAWLTARSTPRATSSLDEPGAEAGATGAALTLRLGPALHAKLAGDLPALHRALAEARGRARAALPVPPLAVALDASLGDQEAALAIGPRADMPDVADADADAEAKASAKSAPIASTPVVWLAAADLAALRDQLPAALAQVAPELIGVDRVSQLVERTAHTAPVLVREVIPHAIALPALAEVLRGLAREQVPLEDLAPLLEAIAVAPRPADGKPFTARDVPALIEQLRGQLRRQISARWAPRGQLAVFTVDAMIEDALRTSVERRDGVAILALEPAIAHDIVAAVRAGIGTGPAVILTSADVRRHLRGLLEPELPEVAILAAHELAPGTSVRTAGRIAV